MADRMEFPNTMKEFIEKLIGRLLLESSGCKVYKLINPNKEDIVEFNVYKKCIEIVNQLAEEYNNGWIPCEVRLPEEDGKRYLVQLTNGIITDLRFAKDAYKVDKYDFAEYKGKKKALFYDYDSEYGFIEIECEAWMPLPAPYKKGE